MTSSKHPKGPEDRKQGLGADTPRPQDDLSRDPGIGSSKGIHTRTGANPEDIAADSTSEGDVMNETDRQGAVNPEHRGRTNR